MEELAKNKKNLKLTGVVTLFPKDVLNIEIQGESEHKSSISHTFSPHFTCDGWNYKGIRYILRFQVWSLTLWCINEKKKVTIFCFESNKNASQKSPHCGFMVIYRAVSKCQV